MDTRPLLLGLALAFSAGCAATPVMQPATTKLDVAVPLLAERQVSFYADHQTIPVPARAPTTALGVDAPDSVHLRAIRVTFDNGDEAMVTTKTTGRVDIPGPPRQLREVELLYASEAPPDTYARIRLYDLSVPEELSPPTNTARR